MQIKVIGMPCTKTARTLQNARAAAVKFAHKPTVQWINDIHEIVEMGRFPIPAIVVNGKFKLTGRIPSIYEITSWIEEELQVEEELAA